MRKICIFTGSRSEYGLLKPLMEEIKKSRSMTLYVVATAMHTERQFGYTINEIRKDRFRIDSVVRFGGEGESGYKVARAIGKGIVGISDALKKINPDIVVLLGDRYETLAAAVASAYMNIPIAHIHGGDSARAGLDEYARHAITKLSNMHFPATRRSMKRIINMGEDRWRIFLVGAPGLDSIMKVKIDRKRIAKKYGADIRKPVLVVLQHPVTTQVSQSEMQMRETMEAVRELGYQAIVIYPNDDAGGRKMIGEIKKYRRFKFIKTFRNIPHDDFIGLMKIASVLIGNSSSGIIESSSFGLPVVNIGIRQEGRERAGNIIDVSHSKSQIIRAVRKTLSKDFIKRAGKCKSPYGNGTSSKKMAGILEKIKIGKKLMQKKITY